MGNLLTGCPAITCCPEDPFQDPPAGIAGQLSGLLWKLPCPGPTVLHYCTLGPAVVDTTVLTGTSNHTFTALLRLRGVIEKNIYVGGAVVPNTGDLVYKGGTTQGVYPWNVVNVYSLTISNPYQLYYVNNQLAGTVDEYLVDFTFAVQITTGATVTLTADPVDATGISNYQNLVVPVGPSDPPILVSQPYNGQFLQMDVVALVS